MDAALRLVTGDDTTSSCTADTGHHHHHGAGGGGFHYTHVVTGGDGNAVTDEADQYVTRTDSLSEPAPFDSYSLSPHIQLRTDAQTYTVVTSSRSGDGDAATHLLEKTAGGGSTFCLQAVGPFVGDSSDSAKSLPQHFIIPDVVGGGTDASGSTYHLGPGGEVYKLVVQADGSKQSDPSAVADHGASQLHLSSSVALDSLLADSHPHLESSSVGVGRCVVCDVQLCDDADGQAVSLYRTCVQSSGVSLAVKLRQLLLACTAAVSDAAPPEFHSELACQPCAALLSSIDGLEARLQELRDRLELARHDLLLKYSRTGARYGCATLTTPSMVQRAEAASLVETASEAPPATAGVCRASQRTTSKKAGHTRQQQRELQPSQRPISKEKQAVVPLQGDHDRPLHQVISDVAACTSRKRPAARTGVQKVAELAEALLDQPDPDDPVGQIPQETMPGPVTTARAVTSGGLHRRGARSGRTSRVVNRCPHCHLTVNNVHLLRAHLVSHPELQHTAAEHLTQHSGERFLYACSWCSRVFASYRRQQLHLRSCQRDEQRCPVCLKGVADGQSLHQHLHEHGARLQCSFCLETCDSSADILRHVEDRHPGALHALQCPLCQACVEEAALRDHLRSSHKVPELRSQCDVCSCLVRKVSYPRHRRAHMNGHRCPVCDKNFPDQSHLTVHLRSHTGERPFSCRHCSKLFVSKSTLDAHVAVLHSQSRLPCPVCRALFGSSKHLKAHMQSHSDVKEHSCPVCSKSFADKSHLMVHTRAVHRGETPHECGVCKKCFPYKASLKDHMLVHTDVKSYLCAVCGKGFRTAKILRSHSYIHRKDKPYRCQAASCESSFSRKDLLARHQLSKHGIAPSVKYSRLAGRSTADAEAKTDGTTTSCERNKQEQTSTSTAEQPVGPRGVSECRSQQAVVESSETSGFSGVAQELRGPSSSRWCSMKSVVEHMNVPRRDPTPQVYSVAVRHPSPVNYNISTVQIAAQPAAVHPAHRYDRRRMHEDEGHPVHVDDRTVYETPASYNVYRRPSTEHRRSSYDRIVEPAHHAGTSMACDVDAVAMDYRQSAERHHETATESVASVPPVSTPLPGGYYQETSHFERRDVSYYDN